MVCNFQQKRKLELCITAGTVWWKWCSNLIQVTGFGFTLTCSTRWQLKKGLSLFKCATLFNLGSTSGLVFFHALGKVLHSSSTIWLNVMSNFQGLISTSWTFVHCKHGWFFLFCVKLRMIISKLYFFSLGGVPILFLLCRKWDIFLQKWGLPRGCFQGSIWWSLLPSCFNVYSSKSAKLCCQVQLWPWFWILSWGLQWASCA